MKRAHVLFCVGICLVTAGCFAVPVFLLIWLIFLLPLLIAGLIREPTAAARLWPLLAITVLGAGGIVGVVRVLVLLCRQKSDRRRWLTFAALACGVAAALIFASSVGMEGAPPSFALLLLLVYVPIACTLLLVYLARRPLFPRRVTTPDA